MGLHYHMTKSYKAVDTLAPPQTKILATPLVHKDIQTKTVCLLDIS